MSDDPAVDACRVCGEACVWCRERRAAAKLEADLAAVRASAASPLVPGATPKFAELKPQLRVALSPTAIGTVDDFASAHGVDFLCPGCFVANGGEYGTHRIRVWFAGRGAPPEITPLPRWDASGSSLADLTLSPSILVRCWHGFIRNGEVT